MSVPSRGVAALDRGVLEELAPVLRRGVTLDPQAVARIRATEQKVTVLLRLPFGVLVARTIEAAQPAVDVTVHAGEFLGWLDGDSSVEPARRDAEWRGAAPPARGWHRIETVPDDAVRPLVRAGALALKDAAAREGVPGAQPRAEVADALLDSVVLTVEDGQHHADITLRALSALTRMGFLPRGGQVHVDTVGRWVRLAAGYGSVFLERPGSQLSLR
jgi:hypothetical protein